MSEPTPQYKTENVNAAANGQANANDHDVMRRILVSLASIFDVKLTDIKIALYYELLRDLGVEAVRAAAFEHMKYGKSFPLPAELRERAGRITLSAQESQTASQPEKSSETPVADFVAQNPVAKPHDIFIFTLDHMFSTFRFSSPEVEIAVVNSVSELTRSWLCR